MREPTCPCGGHCHHTSLPCSLACVEPALGKHIERLQRELVQARGLLKELDRYIGRFGPHDAGCPCGWCGLQVRIGALLRDNPPELAPKPPESERKPPEQQP